VQSAVELNPFCGLRVTVRVGSLLDVTVNELVERLIVKLCAGGGGV
jgi:hypothetical protein